MMPVIFIGHGSPMNAIEKNKFTKGWENIASMIPRPEAILSISAHWTTDGTKVSTLEYPEIIHDFYGFPKELYDVKYQVKGSPYFARKTIELLEGIAQEDNSWGVDHGTWSVLNVMYPNADIPVYQMSIDRNASPKELFEIGKTIKSLRKDNILIMGSGNIVHNLGMLDYNNVNGFDWAIEFDNCIAGKIIQKDLRSIFDCIHMCDSDRLSVPTMEHIQPLLYILGTTDEMDNLEIHNRSVMAGSISMTSYVFT